MIELADTRPRQALVIAGDVTSVRELAKLVQDVKGSRAIAGGRVRVREARERRGLPMNRRRRLEMTHGRLRVAQLHIGRGEQAVRCWKPGGHVDRVAAAVDDLRVVTRDV